MKVVCTTGVEFAPAARTGRIACFVFVDREMVAARAAEHRQLVAVFNRPNLIEMIRDLAMTLETRKPPAAAFEFDRDDIQFGLEMRASSFGVDIDAKYVFTMG